jgi:lambda repressor-like predicted transcriptional regulator
METAEAIRDRIRHEQRVIERLQTANARVADAQHERIWAIKSAHELGLSIRQIAAATGLSSSRIHQVLNTEDPTSIPRSVAQVRGTTKGRKLIATEAVSSLIICEYWPNRLATIR